MSALIEHLRAFNRKERFFLLSHALGVSTFRLDNGFREALGDEIGLSIPDDAYVAMDYHLDWLQIALYLADKPEPPEPIRNEGLIKANQEDIDLLVAFDGAATTHLVLLEAKMETSWTNKQLKSKAQRLSRIFDDRTRSKFAVPSFVLMSPRMPQRVITDDWPDWMKPGGELQWLELPRPKDLRKVTRCTAEGKQSKGGRFVRVSGGDSE